MECGQVGATTSKHDRIGKPITGKNRVGEFTKRTEYRKARCSTGQDMDESDHVSAEKGKSTPPKPMATAWATGAYDAKGCLAFFSTTSVQYMTLSG